MRNGRTWRALCAALLCLALLSGMLASTAEDLALPEDGIAVNTDIEGDIVPALEEALSIPDLDLDVDLVPEDGLVLDSDTEEIALPSGPDEGVDGNAEEDSAGEYVITFVNDDGTVLQQKTYASGEMPRYTGKTPVKADSKKHTYTFAGWVDKADKSAHPTVYGSYDLPEVTADATYKATYDSADRIYTVTFVDEDGKTELWKKEGYAYGDRPEFGGTEPTKASDSAYYYTFSGWLGSNNKLYKTGRSLPKVTADATYRAQYKKNALVRLKVTYTGDALTKVYDCNKYGAYVKDGQVVYVIEALKTIKEKFKLDLADKKGKWIEGHKAVGFKLSLSKQFGSADVGKKGDDYTFEFKVTLTGDDAAYYALKNAVKEEGKDPAAVVKVPAEITPREVVVTPRAGLSKTYGTSDPKYPDGSWLSNDETSPLHQDLSGVAGYGVPLNMKNGKLQLSVTDAAYLMQEARLKGTKFFPGDNPWLTREKGEEAGKYKILIGGMKFGKNFTVKLKDEVFKISKKNLADANVVVKTISNQEYTGKPIKLGKDQLVVTYGSFTLEEGKDFTVKYKNNTKASTDTRKATVTLKGKGNYTGTRKVTFSIIKTASPTATPSTGGGSDSGIHISSVSVDPIPDQAYTGKAVKPSPVLRYNGKRLKKGSDYTLSYENNVRIGTATITVTGKGFFTGTTWLSFNIVPRGTRFTKGTGLKKAVRLEWKKVSGVSGYDIQYTSENHQAGGGFVVSYPNQTQYTLSNLAAGKTYTFNIRTFVTFGGQNYYSPWSRAIKVKTK